MTIKAVIEQGNDGLYSVYLPEIAGLYGTGETESEAKESLNDVIAMALEHVKETGCCGDYVALTKSYTIEYVYDLSGFFKACNFFDITAFAKEVGINPSLMRQYKAGVKKASVTQKAKIYNGIRTIAKKLNAVKF